RRSRTINGSARILRSSCPRTTCFWSSRRHSKRPSGRPRREPPTSGGSRRSPTAGTRRWPGAAPTSWKKARPPRRGKPRGGPRGSGGRGGACGGGAVAGVAAVAIGAAAVGGLALALRGGKGGPGWSGSNYLYLDLQGEIAEQPPTDIGNFFERQPPTLRTLVESLERAADDPRVTAVV